VLRKCAISGANNEVGENCVQSAEILLCAVLPIIKIRDNIAKGTAYSVVCRGTNKALIYMLCDKKVLEISY
jgi:hypothetical protein